MRRWLIRMLFPRAERADLSLALRLAVISLQHEQASAKLHNMDAWVAHYGQQIERMSDLLGYYGNPQP